MSNNTKRIIIQNILNAIVFFTCMIIIVSGTKILMSIDEQKIDMKKSIELEWRQQSKRTLNNIKNQFLYDAKKGIVNPSDELSLQEWAKRNIAGVLNGGSTGDAFMINLSNEKFIWDGSPDCARSEFVEKGRYMKDESPLHVDKVQAEKMINKMRLGMSTLSTYEDNYWNFDGNIEFLEWVVIPPDALGFNDEPMTVGGVKNPKYSKILIVLGTQQDEVESTFSSQFKNLDHISYMTKIFICLSIVTCIINMIFYVYVNKKYKMF